MDGQTSWMASFVTQVLERREEARQKEAIFGLEKQILLNEAAKLWMELKLTARQNVEEFNAVMDKSTQLRYEETALLHGDSVIIEVVSSRANVCLNFNAESGSLLVTGPKDWNRKYEVGLYEVGKFRWIYNPRPKMYFADSPESVVHRTFVMLSEFI